MSFFNLDSTQSKLSSNMIQTQLQNQNQSHLQPADFIKKSQRSQAILDNSDAINNGADSCSISSNTEEEQPNPLRSSQRRIKRDNVKSKSAIAHAKLFMLQISSLSADQINKNPAQFKSLKELQSQNHLCQSEQSVIINSQNAKQFFSAKQIKRKSKLKSHRLVVKIKNILKQDQVLQDESMNYNCLSLMISSNIDKKCQSKHEIEEKINLHLQTLSLLASYANQFKEIYESIDDWQDLMFLCYKKYYIERKKVQMLLKSEKSSEQMKMKDRNVFRFNYCSITKQEIDEFLQTRQSVLLQDRISSQNKEIMAALRSIYNHIIEKSNQFINLSLKENFSGKILTLIQEEVSALKAGEGEARVRRCRINKALKCAFVIAFLDGKQIQIEDILLEVDDSLSFYSKYKHKFMKIVQK